MWKPRRLQKRLKDKTKRNDEERQKIQKTVKVNKEKMMDKQRQGIRRVKINIKLIKSSDRLGRVIKTLQESNPESV